MKLRRIAVLKKAVGPGRNCFISHLYVGGEKALKWRRGLHKRHGSRTDNLYRSFIRLLQEL